MRALRICERIVRSMDFRRDVSRGRMIRRCSAGVRVVWQFAHFHDINALLWTFSRTHLRDSGLIAHDKCNSNRRTAGPLFPFASFLEDVEDC